MSKHNYHECMSEPLPASRKNLGLRTEEFADRVRIWARKVWRDALNIDDLKQVVRSSGSVAANYVEANEGLGKGDRGMKMKICRKEVKESHLWLRLILVKPELDAERKLLCKEADELTRIFHTIIEKYYT